METIATGFLLGGAASFLAWFVTAHLLIPRIEFLETVWKESVDEGSQSYRFCFWNEGVRSAIDVEPLARLHIFDRSQSNRDFIHHIYIPVTSPRIPRLEPMRRTKKWMALTLLPDKLSLDDYPLLPKDVKDELSRTPVDLAKILSRSDGCTLRFYVFCYDSFSGSRKLFESDLIYSQDIKSAGFTVPAGVNLEISEATGSS